MTYHTARLQGIQLLRAVAVLLVVHGHVLDNQYSIGTALQQDFFYLQDFGAAGVDLFFVISGFIITIIAVPYALQGSGWSFFIKRVLRVVPLYWLVSVLSALLSYRHNGRIVKTDTVEKTLLFFPLSDHTEWVGPVLFQGWTLSFEMLFYTVTAVCITIASKKYMPAVVLFFCVCLLLNYATGNHHPMLVFWGNGIMIEFLLGVCCGFVYLSEIKLSAARANAVIVTGIVALLLSLVLGFGGISESYNTVHGTWSLMRSALWGIPAALLVGGIAMKEKIRFMQVYPFLVAIGNASFSIYLTHIMFIQFVYVRWKRWGLQSKVPPDLLVLISLVIVVSLGYLFYLLVEKPLLRRLNAFVGERPILNGTGAAGK